MARENRNGVRTRLKEESEVSKQDKVTRQDDKTITTRQLEGFVVVNFVICYLVFRLWYA